MKGPRLNIKDSYGHYDIDKTAQGVAFFALFASAWIQGAPP